MSSKCPICKNDIKEPERANIDVTVFSCRRCGVFWLSGNLESDLPNIILKDDNKKIATLSHVVRKKYESIKEKRPDERGYYKHVTINRELVKDIIKNPPPNPAEQANNLIRWLGEKSKGYGEYLSLECSKDLSLIGSETQDGFRWIVHHLEDSRLVEANINNIDMDLRLSFEGWEYYQELKKGAVDSRKAFMAMQYGDQKLDKVFNDVFKPAVEQTGFELFILPERPKAGLIDDRLRVEIQTSRFLIADLTHENAGAYWEAGYAEGLGKPVIYTCEKKKFEEKKTHFDTNHHLTIPWDLDNPDITAEELKATIRATLPDEAKLTDDHELIEDKTIA